MRFFTFLLIGSFLVLSSKIHDSTNCDSKICTPDLGNYVYLKSFKFSKNTAASSEKFSIILSKGTRYFITGCSGNGNKNLVYELYFDTYFISSNRNESMGKYYPSFIFRCARTGVYSLKCYIDDEAEECGVVSVAFSRVIKMSGNQF